MSRKSKAQDMQQFLDALNTAKERDNGKPQMIIAHTLIGKGNPGSRWNAESAWGSRRKVCR